MWTHLRYSAEISWYVHSLFSVFLCVSVCILVHVRSRACIREHASVRLRASMHSFTGVRVNAGFHERMCAFSGTHVFVRAQCAHVCTAHMCVHIQLCVCMSVCVCVFRVCLSRAVN